MRRGFLDCHLMVSNPADYVEPFQKAGADMFTYHIEASTNNAGLCAAIKQAGMKAGVALKPGTPVDEALFALVDGGNVDMVLVCEPTAPAPPHRISNTPSLTPTSRFRTAVSDKPNACHSPFRRYARFSAAPLVLPSPFSSPVTTLTFLHQVMTVEPGFGGQKFQPAMMEKVATLRAKYPAMDIQVRRHTQLHRTAM
jgi:hypothetical protein